MKYILIISATVLAMLGTSCKHSDSSPTPVTTVDSGKFYLHLHTNADTNEVEDYGTVYTTSEGRKISVSVAEQYLSNIELVKSDGSIYSITGKIILQSRGTEQYYVATVPVGNYKSVRFHVGLDSAANKLASTADTALNHPEMWFGASAQPNGYIYLNLQGSIDTTTNATGTVAQMQPFMYMTGTNARYTQVTMPDHATAFTVTKDVAAFAHITVDYYKLFTGVQLNNSMNLMIMSTSANSGSLAASIAGNIPSMFSYEE